MRFNLKNRPRFENWKHLLPAYKIALREWFEGFQKELQERYNRILQQHHFPKAPSSRYYPLLKFIEEILGKEY